MHQTHSPRSHLVDPPLGKAERRDDMTDALVDAEREAAAREAVIRHMAAKMRLEARGGRDSDDD